MFGRVPGVAVEEENLEPLVTECPHCETRFRVTDHQLQLAAGRVRCGACLTVFQGVEHLVWDEPSEFQSPEEAQHALDALLDELGGNAETAATAGGELPSQASVAAEPEVSEAARDSGQDAGAWRDSDNQLYGGHEGPTGITLEEHHWPGAQGSSKVDQNTAARVASEPAEVMQDAQTGAAPTSASAARPAAALGAASGSWAGDIAASSGAPAAVADDAPATRAGSAADADFAFGEPGKRRWWIPVAMVVAALTLCTQVLWYQFDRWAVDLQTRPLYAAICQVLDCELPVMRNVDAMVAKNLVVRSHPTVAGALMVNAVVVNEAEFAQPFPILELKFTELNGEPVAGRQFKPEEYLAGELLGAQMIATNVPVHVALAIEDPGPAAVNYYLNFR